MRTAALVYCASLSPYAMAPLNGGASALERTFAFVRQIPGLEAILVVSGQTELPEKAVGTLTEHAGPSGGPLFRCMEAPDTGVAWVLEAARSFCAELNEGRTDELDALVFVPGDEPLLDPALAERMLQNHLRYRADYSFADGYPVGLAAEILTPQILPALSALASKTAEKEGRGLNVEQGWLFSLIQKDINSFDIETEISPKDLREFRLELVCDTKRNTLLVERLMKAGVERSTAVLGYIPEHLAALRTLPAFLQVQIEGGCLQRCSCCPYPLTGGDILNRRDFMPRERFVSLVTAFAEFAGESVVDISLWGEPSLHPEIEGIIDDVLSHPELSLIVETSGLGWKPDSLEKTASRWRNDPRLNFVLSLDAVKPELYARIRGNGFEEALGAGERLLSLFPHNTHIQTLRTRESEPALEEFWRGWKKRTDHVIVQKYSRFAGFLPERKVTDLSPLVRRPCWHLKRDFSVLLDGSVPLCRDCVRSEIMLGNVFGDGNPGIESIKERLDSLWKAGERYHELHVSGEYPPPCAVCDEYYTYNA